MGRTPYVGRLGFENNEDVRRAELAMEQTDVSHLASQPITAISGGERQRVLIARALAQDPSILLLDEPNAHLDLSHQMDVFRILRNQQEEKGITVISVSHDLNLAAAYSTGVVLLAEDVPGRGNTVIAAGDPADVLTPKTIRTVFQAAVRVDQPRRSGPIRISLDLGPGRKSRRSR